MSEARGEGRLPRVAVVGAGLWGRNHVRNYAELGALEAVVDQNAGVAAELAAKHDVRAMSFDDALVDPGIDAFVFALPPSQNYPLGRRALEAGKHLFVEKPMTMTVAEGEELCRLADRLDRRLMVGHILQYHPAFIALRGLVEAGRLGRLLSLVSTRLDIGRIRREEDALWALAPHDVSMILALVGAEPETVTARGGYYTHPTIADVTDLRLAFPGGTGAEIRSSWLHPFKEQKLAVIGESGMAVFDDREPWERKLQLYPHRIVERNGVPFAERAEPEPVPVAQGEPLRQECLHFLDCVRTGARPVSDGWEGLRVLKVLERASAALS
jgi:UDP-2-acetamido-3-amino-2,3-dideoxy-glucuronate N-acetyltransferase